MARKEFNHTVHGGRGLFSGIVLIYHVVNSGLPTFSLLQSTPVEFVLRTSEYGVELFFCISGFVIVGTLRRAHSPASFMLDRFIRIYPVLWVSVLFIVGSSLLLHIRGFDLLPPGIMAWELVVNLLALPGIMPLPLFHPAAWTLSYELTFYGICALAWTLQRRIGLLLSLILIVPFSIGMLNLYPRGFLFLAGVIVSLDLIKIPYLTCNPFPFLVIFLLLWRGIDDLCQPKDLIDTTLVELVQDWRGPLLVLAFVSMTIAFSGIVAEKGIFSKMLRTSAMQLMGTISYSFYLWHPIVMSFIKQEMLNSGLVEIAGRTSQLLFFVFSLPPSLIVAWFSQRILERKVGGWLRRKLRHRASLVT